MANIAGFCPLRLPRRPLWARLRKTLFYENAMIKTISKVGNSQGLIFDTPCAS